MLKIQRIISYVIICILIILITLTINKKLQINNRALVVYKLKSSIQNTSKSPIYLFCSGGYDSIFRLCDLTILKKQYVQPIYLNMSKLDGYDIRRKNIQYELHSIQKSINKISDMGFGKYVLPLQIITNTYLSLRVKNASNYFYLRGDFARSIVQNTYMAEISLGFTKPIETGVLCTKTGSMGKAIGSIINNNTKMINVDVANKHQLIFRNLRFPLRGVSKKQMLQIANQHKFSHILSGTISCWFPEQNGKPCGDCNMCRERII
jgi:hypothetical protein